MLSLSMTMKEAESALAAKEFNDTITACRKAMVSYSALPVVERVNNSEILRRIIELRCDAHLSLDELQESINDAAELCRQFSSNAESFFKLGEIARRSKRFVEAKQYLEHALLVNPKLSRAKVLLRSVETDLDIGASVPEKFLALSIPSISVFERGEALTGAATASTATPTKGGAKGAAATAVSNASPVPKLKTENLPTAQSDEAADSSSSADDEEEDVEEDFDELDTSSPAATSAAKRPTTEKNLSVFNHADAPHWIVYPLILIIFLACFLSIKTFAATAFVYFLHNKLEQDVEIFRLNGIPLSVFSAAIICGSLIF